MNKFVLCFITLLSINQALNAEDYIDKYINSLPNEKDTLFITAPVQIKDLTSVVYVLGKDEFTEKFTRFFQVYANELGQEYGGIILSPDNIYYSQYLEYSYCDSDLFEGNKIIFEDKETFKCYVFNIKNSTSYYNTLVKIRKVIKGNSDILLVYSKSKLREVVRKSDSSLANILIDEITDLFDLIIKKWFLTPKKS